MVRKSKTEEEEDIEGDGDGLFADLGVRVQVLVARPCHQRARVGASRKHVRSGGRDRLSGLCINIAGCSQETIVLRWSV